MAKTKAIDLVDINANSIFTPVDVMDNFNKLKVGINDVSTKVDNIELTDTKIDVVAENKKLNVVLKDLKEKNEAQDTEINNKSTKGEILPSDIKGNNGSYNKIVVGIRLDDDLDLKISEINSEGNLISNWVFLKDKYMKIKDSKKITDALVSKNTEQDLEISEIKKDIGGYAKRLQFANNKIENNI